MPTLRPEQEPLPVRKLPVRVSLMLGFLSLCSYGHGAASALSISAGCFYGRPLLALGGLILGLSAYGGALAHHRLLAQAQAVFAEPLIRSRRSDDRPN